MKFIHCADLHLESKIDSLSSNVACSRREEILKTFENLCNFAKDNSITAVIIAGDVFDSKKVTIKTQKRVLHAISSCSNCDFLCLTGNHDKDVFSSFSDLPNNLYFFNEEWTTYTYGNVNVVGAQLSPANSILLSETLSLDCDKINIVTLHGQVVGYKSNEVAENISLPRFKDKNIDYLALGHIHSFAEYKVDQRCTAVYCGCLDGRGFDELGEKGFVLIDTDSNFLKYNFIPFSSRVYYQFNYDVTGKKDYFFVRDEIVAQLKNNCDSTSLIKLVLKGEYGADFDLDVEGLLKFLNSNFYFCKIYDNTNLIINSVDYELDKSVRGEFVRLVLQDDTLTEIQKKQIISCGLNSLKGEEI